MGCDLNGSYESFPARKVADMLPLGNIYLAAPCLVVLAASASQCEEHTNPVSQIMCIFTMLSFFTITTACYALLIWKIATEAGLPCSVATNVLHKGNPVNKT